MSGPKHNPKGQEDIPENDVRFIVWQLNNLIETTKTGFDDIKKLYVGLDQRVTALELWRAGIDAADKIASDAAKQPKEQTKDSSSTDNLIKIIFIILGLLGTALGLVGSGIIKGG